MDSSNQNSHEMTTRSKSKGKETPFYEFDEESDLSEADEADEGNEEDRHTRRRQTRGQRTGKISRGALRESEMRRRDAGRVFGEHRSR